MNPNHNSWGYLGKWVREFRVEALNPNHNSWGYLGKWVRELRVEALKSKPQFLGLTREMG